MEPLVRISHVNFQYGSTNVLDDISFTVEKGDYIGLIGQNGSGKTTLVKVMLGLLPLASGKVELFNTPLAAFHEWQWIGYMAQHNSSLNPIFPATVREIVTLGLLPEKTYPRRIFSKDRKRVSDALESLQVQHLQDRLIGSLSGGQLQRVLLARAIILEPKLLILDEPSSALDSATREQFFSLLKSLNQNMKTSIILITHDVGEVGAYVNKLMVIDRKIEFFGTLGLFCQSSEVIKKFGEDTTHIICHQHG